jgi:hypothetical protein
MSDQLSITQRLANEAKAGKLNLVRRPKTMTIQVPGGKNDTAARKTIQPIKDWIDQASGTSGSVMDKHLTLRDLMEEGAITLHIGQNQYSGTEPSSVVVGTPSSLPTLLVPPTLTGLTADAAFRNVILAWEMIPYANHAYVEVYRSGTDALGTAVLIGTSTANQYVDANVVVGATYYYWVRAIAEGGALGAFNAVGGTSAALLTIGNTDLGALVVDAGKLAAGTYPNINLVPNPGAEDYDVSAVPAAWSHTVEPVAPLGFLTSTSDKISGSRSFRLNATAGTRTGAGCLAFPIIPGETYSWKLHYYGSASAAGLYARIYALPTKPPSGYVSILDVGMDVVNLLSNVGTSGPWEYAEGTFVAPPGMYWASFMMLKDTGYAGADIFWDEVSIGRQITASFLAANSIAVGTAAIQNLAVTNAMIANLAIDAAKIALATIGTAQIDTLDASVITAGTITTDRIFVGAVTVASAAAVSGASTPFTGVTLASAATENVVTLASTGAPVTITQTLDIEVQCTSGTPDFVSIEVVERTDTSNMRTRGTVYTGKFTASSTTRNARVSIPLLTHYAPAAGSHTYGYQITANFFTSTGATQVCTGSINHSCYSVAQENKV